MKNEGKFAFKQVRYIVILFCISITQVQADEWIVPQADSDSAEPKLTWLRAPTEAAIESDSLSHCLANLDPNTTNYISIECVNPDPSCDGQSADLTQLARFPNLRRLRLRGMCIENLAGLSELTSLRVLDLKQNEIYSISPLAGLKRLKVLSLSSNHVSKLTALSGLTSLRVLDLQKNEIRDISPLAPLTRLKVLSLSNNHVSELAVLAALVKLRHLDLSANPLQNSWNHMQPPAFASLKQLRTLKLDGIFVGDPAPPLAPLSRLRRLHTLSLRDNQLITIRGLVGLSALRRLDLRDNLLANLQPLQALSKLSQVDLRNNMVSDLSALQDVVERGGRLLVDGNCIEACEREGVVCGTQRPGQCANFEIFLTAVELAVAPPHIATFAAHDAPVWTQAQLASGFELIKNSPSIDWSGDLAGGCVDRMLAAKRLLADNGYPGVQQIVSYGRLRPLTPKTLTGYVSWDWHIAVAVFAEVGDASPTYYVFDAALGEQPMTIAQWFARQIDSRFVNLDYRCEAYREVNTSWNCNSDNDGALVVNGYVVVSTPEELTGAICPNLIAGLGWCY